MKEIEYSPTCLRTKDDEGNVLPDPGIEGTVTLRVPSFLERMEYVENCQFKVDKDGNVTTGADAVRALRKMVEYSEKHYAKIALVVKDTGEKITTFQEMIHNSLCDDLIKEVATVLMNGIRPSKNSKPS